MALTKKDREAFDKLEQELRLVKAMRWVVDPPPRSMTIAEIKENCTVESTGKYGKVCVGWFQNAYSMVVSLGCSNGTFHNTHGLTTNSQNAGRTYKTKLDAWHALRYEKMITAANELAKIDAKIQQCMEKQNEEAKQKDDN